MRELQRQAFATVHGDQICAQRRKFVLAETFFPAPRSGWRGKMAACGLARVGGQMGALIESPIAIPLSASGAGAGKAAAIGTIGCFGEIAADHVATPELALWREIAVRPAVT